MGKPKKPQLNKICPICGKAFTTPREYQKTCSLKCGRVLSARSRKEQEQKAKEVLADPFRPVTSATELLVQWYRDDDHMSAEQIARELKRDITVIEKILAKIERQAKV